MPKSCRWQYIMSPFDSCILCETVRRWAAMIIPCCGSVIFKGLIFYFSALLPHLFINWTVAVIHHLKLSDLARATHWLISTPGAALCWQMENTAYFTFSLRFHTLTCPYGYSKIFLKNITTLWLIDVAFRVASLTLQYWDQDLNFFNMNI